ncbi:hypothetical protein NSU_0187 [Novosphingobium pentaromativorans US6-1]|uniref:Uncharacterized protein n=1 Tax=Novosphingobium pentaromativorans US6-1 TaxID=1088721 RepID=G6E7N3_9SPHN|nr:hypothetical protein NSU_0187 [Novosphingobium pentaromativorans US6-1]
MGDRAGPAAVAVIAQQTLAQRGAHRILQLGVERGAHPQAAGVDAVGAVLGLLAIAVDQAAANFLDEVAIARVVIGSALSNQAKRLGLGLLCVFLACPAIADHLVQHPVAPLKRALGMLLAAVDFRRARQDRKESRLAERQLIDVLVEISARGGLHAERTTAQRDLVEIELEDLLLGQHAFDAAGQHHFLQLAGDRVLVANQNVLGDLLGDSRATLGALTAAVLGDVVDHRARKAAEIDAAMGPERAVLRREEGVHQRTRKIDEAQLHAPFARVTVDDLAIEAAHHGRQRRLVLEQLVRVRQVARQENPETDQTDQADDAQIGEAAHPVAGAPELADYGEPSRRFPADPESEVFRRLLAALLVRLVGHCASPLA